jgi:hypothetical protein
VNWSGSGVVSFCGGLKMKGVNVLSLAFDLVIILSLLGMMRSPLTIVWTTRGSFNAYSFERAMTLH